MREGESSIKADMEGGRERSRGKNGEREKR